MQSFFRILSYVCISILCMWLSSTYAFSSIVSVDKVFSDITKDFVYFDELQVLYDRGMIFPDANWRLNPEKLLNRDEFAGIMLEVSCKRCISPNTSFEFIKKYSTSKTFYDVPKSNRNFYCIVESDETEVIQWYDPSHTCEDGTSVSWERPFCIDNKITLEEALALILRSSGIYTVDQNKQMISSITNRTVTDELEWWISPVNSDGSVYTFYGYFKEAIDFQFLDYSPSWEEKIYKLLDSTKVVNPKQLISKQDFIHMAYIALKKNSCSVIRENNLAVGINVYDSTCVAWWDVCTQIDFNKENNTQKKVYDMESKVFGKCESSDLKNEDYVWTMYHFSSWKQDIQYGKYLDNYTFKEPGAWRVWLQVKDPCNNLGNSYYTINVADNPRNNTDTWEDSEKKLFSQMYVLPSWKGTTKTHFRFTSQTGWWDGNYSYNWNFWDWNTKTWKGKPFSFATHKYTQNWSYKVSLVVKDDSWETVRTHSYIVVASGDWDGWSDSDWPLWLFIRADPTNGTVWEEMKFDSTLIWWTWPYEYMWDFWDGSDTYIESNITTKIITDIPYIYSKKWTYTVRLRVRDSDWKTQTAMLSVWVGEWNGRVNEWESGSPLSTVLYSNPGQWNIWENFTFTAETLGWGGEYTYNWDLGDGTIIRSSDDEEIIHAYTSDWSYKVSVEVIDKDWTKVKSYGNVVVNRSDDNWAIWLFISANPANGTVWEEINFDSTVIWWRWPYDYTWNFWDWSDLYREKGSIEWVKTDILHTYEKKWNYTVTLNVKDSKWKTQVATLTVWINNKDNRANWDPLSTVLYSNPGQWNVWEEFTFRLETLGWKGDYIYNWDLGDGKTINNSSNWVIKHSYSTPGTYLVSVEVIDEDGTKVTSQWTIIVKNSWSTEAENELWVILNAEPWSSKVWQKVSFSTNVFDWIWPYTYIWNFWDWSDELTRANVSESSVSGIKHIYNKIWSYPVSVIVEDSEWKTKDAIITVSVWEEDEKNKENPITAHIDADPIVWNTKLTVFFTGTSSKDGGDYVWDFWDGEYGFWDDYTHTYTTPWIYTVTLTVTPDNGWPSWTSQVVIKVLDWDSCEYDEDNDWVMDCNDECSTIFWEDANNGCPIFENKCWGWCECREWYECSSNDTRVCTTEGYCTPKRLLMNSCLQEWSSGIILGNAQCLTCPCEYSLDFNSKLRKCDFIFPAITSPDSSKVFSRGDVYRVLKEDL